MAMIPKDTYEKARVMVTRLTAIDNDLVVVLGELNVIAEVPGRSLDADLTPIGATIGTAYHCLAVGKGEIQFIRIFLNRLITDYERQNR